MHALLGRGIGHVVETAKGRFQPQLALFPLGDVFYASVDGPVDTRMVKRYRLVLPGEQQPNP